MSGEALKLSVLFGERDRDGDGLLSDALLQLLERHELRTAALLRGTEGFGLEHRLRRAGLLTTSEDLPLVATAVDAPERVRAALAEVGDLVGNGLVTLEGARLVEAAGDADAAGPGDDAKLTISLGRRQRVGGRPAYQVAIDALARGGVAGATALLGVDGLLRGRRQRARMLSPNSRVPLLVVSVGDRAAIAAVLGELLEVLGGPTTILEGVQVLRRDGKRLAQPRDIEPGAPWARLTVYSARHNELVAALREAGAPGATVLRGVWGYHGDHEPHGESPWALRRRTPVVTELVVAAAELDRWLTLVERFTADHGLVALEPVPFARATGAGTVVGSLDEPRA
jgi:PII-like signaling protein